MSVEDFFHVHNTTNKVRRSMNQTSALRTCDRLHVPMDTAGRDSERFDRDRCRSSPYASSRRGTPRLTSHFSQTIHNPSQCDTSSPVTSKTPVLSWCSCVCVAQAQDSCLFPCVPTCDRTPTQPRACLMNVRGLLNRRSIESLETCTAAIGAQSVSCASRRQSEISQAGDRRRGVIAEQTRWKVPDIWSDTLLGAKERQGAFDRTARSDALEAPCSSPETLTAMSASIASDHGRAASGSPPFSTFDWDDVGLENPMSDACSSSIDTLCSPLACKDDCSDVETGGVEGEIEWSYPCERWCLLPSRAWCASSWLSDQSRDHWCASRGCLPEAWDLSTCRQDRPWRERRGDGIFWRLSL